MRYALGIQARRDEQQWLNEHRGIGGHTAIGLEVIDPDTIKNIAECYDYDPAINEANARFIAAGPDMETALDAVITALDTNDSIPY